MRRLRAARNDVGRRIARGVEREVPAPVRDRRQRDLQRIVRHVEDHVQILLVRR